MQEKLNKLRENFHNFYIENDKGCWIWQKSKNSSGYGMQSYLGKPLGAHRVSYLLFKGEIPKKLDVMHSCHQRDCVNFYHLKVGTRAENLQDIINRNYSDKPRIHKTWNTNKEWRRPGKKRLSMDVEYVFWSSIRDHAQMANVSISKWVRRAIVSAMKEEIK